MGADNRKADYGTGHGSRTWPTEPAEPPFRPAQAAEDDQLLEDLRQPRIRGCRKVQDVRTGHWRRGDGEAVQGRAGH